MYDLTPAEWREIMVAVDFTDEERQIIEFRRRGWKWIDIAAEIYRSERQLYRISKRISAKILKGVSCQ